ncbi:hypothetical protein [Streptomyces sp. NPDC059008]|uniref:hypothetical protein n=1 Tax=Streptomyces sp. NPDC059008 TaxID=3346693 RepID=UPI0036B0B177
MHRAVMLFSVFILSGGVVSGVGAAGSAAAAAAAPGIADQPVSLEGCEPEYEDFDEIFCLNLETGEIYLLGDEAISEDQTDSGDKTDSGGQSEMP